MTAHPWRGHPDVHANAGVLIETLHNPSRYTHAQIERACAVVRGLARGKLVLVEPPTR
jgi:hypothetical protein